MKAPAEHQVYLAKRNYPLNCPKNIFDNEEFKFLRRYGFWVEALVSGVLLPITDEEKRLIEVHIGKIEPTNVRERAWRKLIDRKLWDKKEKTSPHYKLIDKAEQFFSRSDWKKMRSQKNF
jgi:uncharacterized protein YifE (UPF0438 family)